MEDESAAAKKKKGRKPKDWKDDTKHYTSQQGASYIGKDESSKKGNNYVNSNNYLLPLGTKYTDAKNKNTDNH